MRLQATRAVLFDMDGVLVDSYEAWFHLMNAAADHFGYPPITRIQFRRFWGQGPDLDVELCFTRHSLHEVERYYNDHFRNHAAHVRTNPRAREVFASLRKRGLCIAVITNTPSPIAREVLGRARIAPDVLVGGTDVPCGKPAPDMVLKAMELLGVSPPLTLLVGDSDFDRQAAAAAAVRFLQYNIETDGKLDIVMEVL